MLRENWIDRKTNSIQSIAFIRRPKNSGKDIDGLSVNIAATCTPVEVSDFFENCYGIGSLHTGRIRDVGLNAMPDGVKHANIIGLPYPEEDQLEAERLATLLAKQARIIPD
ncbi:hypothetical protein BH10CHL1_BH10CHL1_51190 [soil metagenome]